MIRMHGLVGRTDFSPFTCAVRYLFHDKYCVQFYEHSEFDFHDYLRAHGVEKTSYDVVRTSTTERHLFNIICWFGVNV